MTASSQARRLLGKQGPELTEGIVQELEALHNELAGLREQVALLRSVSPDVSPATADFPGVSGPVVIAAGDALGPEQGFYPAEQTDAGAVFNWSGPSPQISFDVTIDRPSGAELRMEGINFLDFDGQKDVKLFADGLEVPLAVEKAEPGIVITATLPPAATVGQTQLRFLLPETRPPANAEDKRMLGLAFLRLTIVPIE